MRLREAYQALHQRAVVPDERLHAHREHLDAERARAEPPPSTKGMFGEPGLPEPALGATAAEAPLPLVLALAPGV